MNIQNQPAAALRKRRSALLRQLPPLQAILRGSLIERYKRCGKPGCKCADGLGHGPKYYLSVSYPGLRPQMDYVPQGSYAQTAEFLANYHRAREILEAICQINRELLRRREALERVAMSETLSALHGPIDAGLGGVLLANMLEAWLDGDPKALPTAEASDESQNHRTSPEQTGLHLFAPVDAEPSPSPSGEQGAPVRTAGEGAGAGLERIPDPHARSGPGQDGYRNGGAGGLQDFGGGCFDGSSRCGVCIGSLAVSALEPRLASAAGVVCAHRNLGDRRRWLLRSGGLQRRIVARIE